MMKRRGLVGVFLVAGLMLAENSAHAQYYGDPGGYGYPAGGYAGSGYRSVPRGVSVQIGVGAVGSAVAAPGFGGYPGGYGGLQGGYTPGWSGGAGQGYARYPSPAERQGYREGRIYWETGVAPSRPLSPAESRGFLRGEQRAATTPWQLDPARQQGYREGQLYWETGIAPNRPLSPAESQGFQAGERRAAGGYPGPY